MALLRRIRTPLRPALLVSAIMALFTLAVATPLALAQDPQQDDPQPTPISESQPTTVPAIGELIIEQLILQMPESAEDEAATLTTLDVEGVASRSIAYDGAVGRFTISVLRDSVLKAVNDGNVAAQAVADAVDEACVDSDFANPEEDPEGESTCVSPDGLQTTGIRIYEEFDWTERGRVSQGFRYENQLSIAIVGTGYAGALVDLVVGAGQDLVRFDGLDFTVSNRAEVERQVMLDAIDDAQATAQRIAAHMQYEIVRIVQITPGGVQSAIPEFAERAAFADEEDAAPTPVFGGSDTITSRVTIHYELRPITTE